LGAATFSVTIDPHCCHRAPMGCAGWLRIQHHGHCKASGKAWGVSLAVIQYAVLFNGLGGAVQPQERGGADCRRLRLGGAHVRDGGAAFGVLGRRSAGGLRPRQAKLRRRARLRRLHVWLDRLDRLWTAFRLVAALEKAAPVNHGRSRRGEITKAIAMRAAPYSVSLQPAHTPRHSPPPHASSALGVQFTSVAQLQKQLRRARNGSCESIIFPGLGHFELESSENDGRVANCVLEWMTRMGWAAAGDKS
jgi:hypothetical protein